MPNTTDEELLAKQKRLQDLRDQVAAAEAKRIEVARGLENDLALSQMEAEEARLQAQLVNLREQGRVSVAKAGVADILDANKQVVKAANAEEKAATKAAETTKEAKVSTSKPVDTSAVPVVSAPTKEA